MANSSFLEKLMEVLDKNFRYDYELNWDKRQHTIELSFLLEAHNPKGVETIDANGQTTTEDIFFEEALLFYHPTKSHFHPEDYLVALPYLPKKGFSQEFLTYLVDFLNQTADQGLDDLLDFLEDDQAQEFVINWDAQLFEAGKSALVEGEFFPYPRY